MSDVTVSLIGEPLQKSMICFMFRYCVTEQLILIFDLAILLIDEMLATFGNNVMLTDDFVLRICCYIFHLLFGRHEDLSLAIYDIIILSVKILYPIGFDTTFI